MGNICGKTEPEPDAQAGRRLGSAPPPGPKTARVPQKVGGPPRTLGGAAGDESGGGDPADARRRAAEAAEVSSPSPFPLTSIYVVASIYVVLCAAVLDFRYTDCFFFVGTRKSFLQRRKAPVPAQCAKEEEPVEHPRRSEQPGTARQRSGRGRPGAKLGLATDREPRILPIYQTYLPIKEAGNTILRVAGLRNARVVLYSEFLFFSFQPGWFSSFFSRYPSLLWSIQLGLDTCLNAIPRQACDITVDTTHSCIYTL